MRLETFVRLARPRSADEYSVRYPHGALVFDAGTTGAQCPAPSMDGREIQFLVKTRRNALGDAIVLGRGAMNDLKIDHPSISKIHVAFLRFADTWAIVDPGSTNGTHVDGVPLPKNEIVRLPDGARLNLGGEITARFYSPRSLFPLLAEVADARSQSVA